MRAPQEGHTAQLEVLVTPEMTVRFGELGPLHPVYATYELARHFEEVGRKLLLPLLEDGEDGVGTLVRVEHLRSALPGMRVRLTATVRQLEGRRLSVEVTAISELGDTIAVGHTVQYVTRAERIQAGFEELQARWGAHQQVAGQGATQEVKHGC